MKLTPPQVYRVTTIGAAIISGLSVAAALADPTIARQLFSECTYPLLWLLGLIVISVGFTELRGLARRRSLRDSIKEHAAGLLCAAVLVTLIFSTVPLSFKVLDDETNLLRTSLALHASRSPWVFASGYFDMGAFHGLDSALPWRPLGFPFALHIVHHVFGPSPNNVFLLNGWTLFVLLSGVYLAMRAARISISASIATQVLVACVPILSMTSTSGSFDVVASTLALGMLGLLARFVQTGRDSALRLFWLTGLLATHVRYEGLVVFCALVTGAVLLGHLRFEHARRHSLLLALTPLLVAPWLWQRIGVGSTDVEAFEHGTFSAAYLIENLEGLAVLFDPTARSHPFAAGVNLLGLACLAAYCWRQLRTRTLPSRAQLGIGLLAAGMLTLLLLLFQLHFRGNPTIPTSARFYIVLSVMLACAPVLLVKILGNEVGSRALAAAAVLGLALYLPVAIRSTSLKSLGFSEVLAQTLSVLDSGGPHSDTLVLSASPSVFLPFGYGSLHTSVTRGPTGDSLARLMVRNPELRVVAIQMIRTSDGTAVRDTHVADEYPLRPIHASPLGEGLELRLSKIVAPTR